jgi:outer membrane lipoprotein LolB
VRAVTAGCCVVLVLLGGCAAQPARVTAPAAEIKAVDLTGRISLKQAGHSGVANLHWHHAPPDHDIRLYSALGETIADIAQDRNGVTLLTAQKQRYSASDADSLMEQVLGWSLPLNGMQYWILGRAAPGGTAEIQRGPDNRIQHMVQDHWQIDYSNYRPVGSAELPGKIFMQRDDVKVRVVIDSWKVLPDSR